MVNLYLSINFSQVFHARAFTPIRSLMTDKNEKFLLEKIARPATSVPRFIRNTFSSVHCYFFRFKPMIVYITLLHYQFYFSYLVINRTWVGYLLSRFYLCSIQIDIYCFYLTRLKVKIHKKKIIAATDSGLR